ncbi:MAG: 2-thiouracil desulfurase family protein [Thermodesulfobacteriota bacterium]|nr:2-thiouracil desulfurase family protein [Thermodesulfobacteriota bacterium]
MDGDSVAFDPGRKTGKTGSQPECDMISLTEKIRLLQGLLDAIPSPVFYKDRNGTYVACNRPLPVQPIISPGGKGAIPMEEREKPMEKPTVVVSKCLGFDHCRYNGQMIPDSFVENLAEHVEMIPVCPEMAIGLGVPRDPVRVVLVNGEPRLYQPATGEDFTEAMEQFTHEFLAGLPAVDGFIMKSRSPSCGIRDVKIYHHMDRPDTGTERGGGMFGGRLKALFPGTAIEDEGRLKNFSIRKHFLSHLLHA